MGTMKWRARRNTILVGTAVVGLGSIVAVANSPSVRTSFGAAYRAFCDPSLLEHRERVESTPTGRTAIIDENRLLDAAIAKDFEKASEGDFEDPDGATLATLSMPDLRVPITRRTMRFVRFFARTEGGRTTFGERFQRSGRYRATIEHALREAGLPEDLVWLTAIESGFDPRAVSPAGAAGLFQFMPATGALYGLSQSNWVDDRRSIKRATTAAVAHLRDLYERFDRWDLALAAYNCGVDNVLRAMSKAAATRPAGQTGPITFAELAQQKLLPEETANYVPQIVAFSIVANNRARFGLDGISPEPPLELGELAVPEGTRLRTIARAAGIPTRLLREYNPELLRDRTPTSGGDYVISLPADRVQQTLAAFPAYLENERVDDPGLDADADPGNPLARPRLEEEVEEHDDDEDALPPRPSPLGRNRLPEFVPPGGLPVAVGGGMLGFGGPVGAKLPLMMVGGGVGWQRPGAEDPFAALVASQGQGASQQAAAKAIGGSALEKSLGFIPPAQKLDALPDPFQRFVLANGIVVKVRPDPAAPRVAITVRIAPDEGKIVGVSDAPGEAGTGETRHTITVNKQDVDLGLELAAGRLRLLLSEASGTQLAGLRRLSASPRRRALERAPYGPAWLALGDALFPAGHPLEGRVLGAREDAIVARDLLLTEMMAEERSPARASVTLIGDVTKERIEQLVGKLLAPLPPALMDNPIGPHPREERLTVEQMVPSVRSLYGWIAPGEADLPSHAAMRAAMWILSSAKGGRLDRALVERGFAAQVRALLDADRSASVAVVEVVPAVPHDMTAVEAQLDAAIDAFVAQGPTAGEIATAVAHLKTGLKKELASGKGPIAQNAPLTANSARLRQALAPGAIDALMVEFDKLSVAGVKAAVRKTLVRSQRVVVTTVPKGGK
jgi:predicted Zn-dependent peptidase